MLIFRTLENNSKFNIMINNINIPINYISHLTVNNLTFFQYLNLNQEYLSFD